MITEITLGVDTFNCETSQLILWLQVLERKKDLRKQVNIGYLLLHLNIHIGIKLGHFN